MQQAATRACTPTSGTGSGMAWLQHPFVRDTMQQRMWGMAARLDAHAIAEELEGQRKVTAGQQNCHMVLICLLPVSPWFLRSPDIAA